MECDGNILKIKLNMGNVTYIYNFSRNSKTLLSALSIEDDTTNIKMTPLIPDKYDINPIKKFKITSCQTLGTVSPVYLEKFLGRKYDIPDKFYNYQWYKNQQIHKREILSIGIQKHYFSIQSYRSKTGKILANFEHFK